MPLTGAQRRRFDAHTWPCIEVRPWTELLHEGYAVSAYPSPQWCRVSRHLLRALLGVPKRYTPLIGRREMRLPSCMEGNGYCVSPQPLAFREPPVTMDDDGDDVLTPLFSSSPPSPSSPLQRQGDVAARLGPQIATRKLLSHICANRWTMGSVFFYFNVQIVCLLS